MGKSIEILDMDNIRLLVDSFYSKIRKDDLLKDIFDSVIGDRWPQHLEKMYRFWQTVLLEERTYNGRPLLPHIELPVDKEHFERWVSLWEQTLDEHFHGSNAEAARWQANRMAEMFYIKISFFRQNTAI